LAIIQPQGAPLEGFRAAMQSWKGFWSARFGEGCYFINHVVKYIKRIDWRGEGALKSSAQEY